MPSPESGIGGNLRGFLSPHQIQAAERFSLLFERCHLQAHVTMHYGPRIGGPRRGSGSIDIADTAADARRKLERILAQMPPECAGVVLDICGYEKGLQDVERERGWPRRSAKLVLRIGLDVVARLLGLSEYAQGPEGQYVRTWLAEDARPQEAG